MWYDYKGWWINSAQEYINNYRNGAICVTFSKDDIEKVHRDLPRLVTTTDIDQYAYGFFLMKYARNIDDSYKALQISKALMAKGNVLGNYLYAHLIFENKVLKRIDEIGLQHFLRVLQDIPDFAPDLYNVGLCHYRGEGTPKNIPLALEYFEKARQGGFNAAINYIGLLYYNGHHGYPLDYYKAFECFRESSFRGDEKGYYFLGILYNQGKGCTQDYKRALDCFALAGTKGHIDAAYSAGLMQTTGTNVPKNIDAAAYYLNIAAKGGRVEAMYFLATLYLGNPYHFYGKEEEGKAWLIKACQQVFQDAIALDRKLNIRY